MAGKASIARANGKKGGRPKGSKSPETLEREAVLKAFRERVFCKADVLFDAQLSLAKGCEFLFRVDRPKEKGEKSRHVLVTDPDEIKAFLDGDEIDDAYRYITTKEPSNQAIADMLNRALGKPIETHELSGPDGGPLTHVIQNIERGVE